MPSTYVPTSEHGVTRWAAPPDHLHVPIPIVCGEELVAPSLHALLLIMERRGTRP
ncbi:hypothetical protein KC19_6G098000 [Ceratodon purpureus]|uniref:Uncharacterized protein n=1 Tax=Ceratodon purpureus TaxID=3225 RepID=A0A8T0HFY0_CERPU|nr:hypothetical protein KC19_6G098000 [Ceratodon purpureus]